MSAYQALVNIYEKINHFSHISSICHWDQAAMMPSGGNHARSEAMATLSVHIHQLSTDPKIATLIQQAHQQDLTDEARASLREMERSYSLATVLPDDFVAKKSLAGSTCEHAWRQQRPSNDWQGFSQNFKRVVQLAQEEAKIRAEKTGLNPYDAMLDIYEPGMTCERLDEIFSQIKTWLPKLTDQVITAQEKNPIEVSENIFPITAQQELGLVIMKQLGFDFNHGRLDISTHPFCGGVSQDVRITTRYDDKDFQQSLMGIIHETGHACYEQGLPRHLNALPAGKARSMGIHESQSLFFEMQIGRHPEFLKAISPIITEHFPKISAKQFTPCHLQYLYSRVTRGLIRVDADELTYPFHVILRYEIERDLMNGEISYKDIPTLWDEKMRDYLGLDTRGDFKNGCMQDIHWTDGAFGYFPSYTLGAMYAAQIMATLKKDIDVDACFNQLNLQPIQGWLKKNIWQNGSILLTDELVQQATGETLNPIFFQQHLTSRYLR